MKRLLCLMSFAFIFSLVSVLGVACDLSVSLLNQDPYEAVPGDYVKLVFQVDGLANPDCGDVSFQLLEKYPISFDGSSEKTISLKSGTFVRSFSSYATVAYKVRVDENALDGENPIEVAYATKGSSNFYQFKTFNLSIQDVRAKFEVYVKDYNFNENEITLEILNTAKSDVNSITLEIEENVKTYGSKTRIIGDLDSNEYTTANFQIVPIASEIPIKILYTDSIGVRRQTSAVVFFNPDDFSLNKPKQSSAKYWIVGIVILGIGYWFYRKRKNKSIKRF